MSRISVEKVETLINGIRVINFPKPEGVISTQAVASIAYAIPQIVKSSIVIDYNKISPEIFKAIKIWYHEKIELGKVESEETYPIVCPNCFGQLKDTYASETHTYDPGIGTRTLILHDVPQRKCQSCFKSHKLNLLDIEIETLLDDFFLFHLNGRIEIPEEVDLSTLIKFKGASKKAKEFRQKSKEAEKLGITLSAIDFVSS